jgi:hypothetical protein
MGQQIVSRHGKVSGSDSQYEIDVARAVSAKARRMLADSDNTNEQGAKSSNPESDEDENETTKPNLSGKKEDETSSDRWMDG